MESVEIPSGVTSIGNYAFRNCTSLTSVLIPDSVTSIGSYAFYNCSSLVSIEIPSGVTSIGSYAFSGCSMLKIYCEAESQPSGWNTSWNYYNRPVVWGVCQEHTFVITTVAPTCTASGYDMYDCSECTISYTLTTTDPKGHTYSPNGVCVDCKKIKDGLVNVEESKIESIYANEGNIRQDYVQYMFDGDLLVGGIYDESYNVWFGYVGDTLTVVFKEEVEAEIVALYITGNWCVANVYIYDADGKLISSGEAIGSNNNTGIDGEYRPIYNDSDGDKIPDSPARIKVKSVVVEVESYKWNSPKTLQISEILVATYKPAHNHATDVKTVVAPTCENEGYTYYTCEECGNDWGYGEYVDALGHSLGEIVTVSPSCTSNGYDESVCLVCEFSVKTNYIPGLIHNFVDGVCTICEATYSVIEEWDVSYSKDDNVIATLLGDPEKMDAFLLKISGTGKMCGWDSFSRVPWNSKYANTITGVIIEDGVTNIGTRAFDNCVAITNVVIPYSVTSLDDYAFAVCTSLLKIDIPNSVVSIGKGAFARCEVLPSIVIPNSVTTFGDNMFRQCYKLTSVILPNGITSIDNSAFYQCYELTSVTLPSSITSIGNSAFCQCSGLISIDIPNGVKTIDISAFDGCTELASVKMPNSLISIGAYAFRNCTNLTSIVIPKGVTETGGSLFVNCEGLTIYVEAESQPSGWNSSWNATNCPVVWDCVAGAPSLEDVFVFKGYSFNETNGSMAVGFDVDYEVIALYKAKTGRDVDIGAVFASYDNLGGKQPLDENGNAIVLEKGRVVNVSLNDFAYQYYDFMVTNIDDSVKDVKLVIAAYIYDGESVKYVQGTGISDTVSSISYNEAKESVED